MRTLPLTAEAGCASARSYAIHSISSWLHPILQQPHHLRPARLQLLQLGQLQVQPLGGIKREIFQRWRIARLFSSRSNGNRGSEHFGVPCSGRHTPREYLAVKALLGFFQH
jgi:hypothetical protein